MDMSVYYQMKQRAEKVYDLCAMQKYTSYVPIPYRNKLKEMNQEELIQKVINWFCKDRNRPNAYEYVKDELLDNMYPYLFTCWGIQKQHYEWILNSCKKDNAGALAYVLEPDVTSYYPNLLWKFFITKDGLKEPNDSMVNIVLHELFHTTQNFSFTNNKELEVIKECKNEDLRNYGWSIEYYAYNYAFLNVPKCIADIVKGE